MFAETIFCAVECARTTGLSKQLADIRPMMRTELSPWRDAVQHELENKTLDLSNWSNAAISRDGSLVEHCIQNELSQALRDDSKVESERPRKNGTPRNVINDYIESIEWLLNLGPHGHIQIAQAKLVPLSIRLAEQLPDYRPFLKMTHPKGQEAVGKTIVVGPSPVDQIWNWCCLSKQIDGDSFRARANELAEAVVRIGEDFRERIHNWWWEHDREFDSSVDDARQVLGDEDTETSRSLEQLDYDAALLRKLAISIKNMFETQKHLESDSKPIVRANIPKFIYATSHKVANCRELAVEINQAAANSKDTRSENQVAIEFCGSLSSNVALNLLQRIRAYERRKANPPKPTA